MSCDVFEARNSCLQTVELSLVEDDHTVDVLPDTWQIVDHVAPRATALRAVVFECERNSIDEVVPGFRTIQDRLNQAGLWGAS